MLTLHCAPDDYALLLTVQYCRASLPEKFQLEKVAGIAEARLELPDESAITGTHTIALHLATMHTGQLVPTDPVSQASIHNLLSVSRALSVDTLVYLDEWLKNKTYLVQERLTVADWIVWARVRSWVLEWQGKQWKGLKHWEVLRWWLLIQANLRDSLIALELTVVEVDIDALTRQQSGQPATVTKAEKQKKKQNPDLAAAATTEKPAETLEENAAGGKKKKKPAAAGGKAVEAEPAVPAPVSPGLLDIRVGFIRTCKRHPDADSLYIEEIDVGEAEPRVVISGLVNHIPLENMLEQKILVMCNLKPVSMRGVKSHAMVLCATAADGEVTFVRPPAAAIPGTPVQFEGHEQVVPEKPFLNPKKKIWEQLQVGLKTNDSGEAGWLSEEKSWHRMHVGGESCATKAINATIK